jgi:hypothetical protein
LAEFSQLEHLQVENIAKQPHYGFWNHDQVATTCKLNYKN